MLLLVSTFQFFVICYIIWLFSFNVLQLLPFFGPDFRVTRLSILCSPTTPTEVTQRRNGTPFHPWQTRWSNKICTRKRIHKPRREQTSRLWEFQFTMDTFKPMYLFMKYFLRSYALLEKKISFDRWSKSSIFIRCIWIISSCVFGCM